MKILIVSPFHGRSSHAAWAAGYARHSRHEVAMETLEDRAWAWRMRGGAVPLARRLETTNELYDAVLATSMTDLSTLYGLLRQTDLVRLPTVLYMHENQLTYPIRPGGRRDRHLAFIQYQSMLVADAIWFNSEHNRSAWFEALPSFLETFPDHHGSDLVESLRERSRVVPVGLDLPPSIVSERTRPLLLWNQRWEWDKNPKAFIDLVKRLSPRVDFEVVLLGGRPQRKPPDLEAFEDYLGGRLGHSGWCPREEYERWLGSACLTVSTARHEFFGISILEAASCGVFPLLPDRLSYPEVIPDEHHDVFLYRSRDEMVEKALAVLEDPARARERARPLVEVARSFAWERMAPRYDELLDELVSESRKGAAPSVSG